MNTLNKFKNINGDWTLFLDRDGVINRKIDGDYVRNVQDFTFLPGVLEAIAQLSTIFGRIIVVTNQQGIGKGLMTHEDLYKVHSHMTQVVGMNGGRIDQVYYCPYLEIYDPACRKPNPGMAFQAKEDFSDIDFKKSVMVGDSSGDIGFGKNVGMLTIKISPKLDEWADKTFVSLYEFAEWMKMMH